MSTNVSFEYSNLEYDFSKEFELKNRKLKDEECQTICDFQSFFNSIDDKTPLKELILGLASHYSDKKS